VAARCRTRSNFEVKRVLVVGLARTGVAAALFCSARGAVVHATDTRSEAEIGDSVARLRDVGVALSFGAHDESILRAQDLVIPSPGVAADAPLLLAAKR